MTEGNVKKQAVERRHRTEWRI